MVENLDRNVGRVLEALDRTGKADATIVVFTSDNGGLSTAEGSPTSNAPLSEGKGWTEEGGIREPLLVRWPGVVSPGTRISEPVTSPDFFPTLVTAAGGRVDPTLPLDGVDFGPALRGRPFERGPIYWHYPHYSNQGGRPSSAIRHGRWKLIHHFEDKSEELFDLEADVGERHDVSKQQPDMTAALSTLLRTWMLRVGARRPLANPHPEPFVDLAGYFLGGEVAEAVGDLEIPDEPTN
jgi:arylsulfatase A-like enzyme